MSVPNVLALSDMFVMAMSAYCAAFCVSFPSDVIKAALKPVTCSMYWFADMPAVL